MIWPVLYMGNCCYIQQVLNKKYFRCELWIELKPKGCLCPDFSWYMCRGIFSIWRLVVLFPITAALFLPHDWVVCNHFASVLLFTRSLPFIHSTLIWLWDFSVLWSMLSSVHWYGEWSSNVGVASQAWKFCVRCISCFLKCHFMLLRLSLIEFNLHFVSACACIFYKPLGMSLCHQIWDIDQHAFERRRTSMKWIVPVHLPQHSLYEGTICWLVYDGEYERRRA